MPTFLEAAESVSRRAFCTVLGRAQVFDLLVRRTLPGGGFFPTSPAEFLYPLVCNRPAPQQPQQFTGGQCPKQYTVRYTRRITRNGVITGEFGGTATLEVGNFLGAVGGLVVTRPTGNSVRLSLTGADSRSPLSLAEINSSNASQYDYSRSSIVSVTPVDGSADNCGNPPSTVQPYLPGDNQAGDNFTYNDNNGTSITVPVIVAFGYASVNLNGEFEIPVTFDFSLEPTFNFEATFNFNTGKLNPTKPTSPDAEPPSLPGVDDPNPQPDTDVPPIPDPENPDTPPDDSTPKTRRLLRGVIVSVSGVPPYLSRIYQNPNPDLVLPDFGMVQFKIQVGRNVAWTAHTKVQSVRQFIPCPWEYGAVDVKGTARNGVTWRLTPVYVTQTYSDRYPAVT